MSFLDITPRDLLHAAYMAYVRTRNWAKITLNPGRYRPPIERRPVLSRFPGARNGSDIEMFTSLPERVTFPCIKHSGRAAYIGPEADIMAAIRDNAPEFGAKVYELDRITRADHLGPTEAEYREWRHDAL